MGNRTSVDVSELQHHAAEFVERASKGEMIEIADGDHPRALLVPVERSWLTALSTAGRIRPARRHLADLPPPLKADSNVGIGELLTQARHDER